MESEAKEFLNATTKKLEKIEKKIQEMKLNIVIMSFYSDIKLIEETLLSYQSQGYKVNQSLLEKIEKFKILLQSNKNLPKLGKKFIELTEEFYNLRKRIYEKDRDIDYESIKKIEKKPTKKKPIDYLLAYV